MEFLQSKRHILTDRCRNVEPTSQTLGSTFRQRSAKMLVEDVGGRSL